MPSLTVILLQLPHPLFPERNMPFAPAFLISAVNHDPEIRENIRISLCAPEIMNYAGDAMLIDHLVKLKPDCIGVSLYLWNIKRTLSILTKIKAALPELKVIAGGPEVYPESHFLKEKNNIDFFVFGEGELALTRLLRHMAQGNPDYLQVPGIAFRNHTELIFTKHKNEYYDPADLDLPYSSGIVSPQDYDRRMVFLYTMRGCPFACTYCSWSGRGKLRPYDRAKIFNELGYLHKLAVNNDEILYIFIMDSAFNFSLNLPSYF